MAEEGVQFKTIATLISQKLNIPLVSLNIENATNHFSWFTHFAQLNNLSSSEITRNTLNWKPQHSTLKEDLEDTIYFTKY
ncbi:Rossmann-fold NAD(P)-binding domain-containing protein [Chryseobacterium nematophagum]|uniref:hypothetical protein n=1 Tax=Chryseobacterium nematophagum TaxID=2305228 RepID=UPI001E482C33|nr:hypothetical protein [Chryseobacterium nematophagum]